MATKHNHSSGAILPLTDGGTAHARTLYEQDISVDPVTGKPISAVTSLQPELIVLDGNLDRHIVSIVPFRDGSGAEIHVDNRHSHTIKWRNR